MTLGLYLSFVDMQWDAADNRCYSLSCRILGSEDASFSNKSCTKKHRSLANETDKG